MGRFGDQPAASGRTTPQARHVGLGRRLVEKDQARGLERALRALPAATGAADVGAVLLGCPERLFLKVRPIAVST
jgi:hypothetical protein